MNRYALKIIMVTFVLFTFIYGVSAVSVTVIPDRIDEGDTITVNIEDLPDESYFTLQMSSIIKVDEDLSFVFQTEDVTVPFGLNDAFVNINVSPVTEAGIRAINDGSIRGITWLAKSGVVSGGQSIGDTSPGSIDLVEVSGISVDEEDFVDMELEISGTKVGTDSGSITFGFDGFSEGGISIAVIVDGSEVANQAVIVGNPVVPDAEFSGLPINGEAPLVVSFADESDGVVTGRLWDFGDGASSTLANPEHVYDSGGVYTVSLTVENWGGSDTVTKEDYITVTASPVADFEGSPVSGTSPLRVDFSDLSTGNPTSWLWDFGDGNTSTEENPQNVYSSVGTYTVSLTVENADGSDSVTKEDYITVTASELPDHSLYIGDTAVSINYLIYYPEDSLVLVNSLVSRQEKTMAELWYKISGEPVRNILTLNDATEEELVLISSMLITYVDDNGEEKPI